MARGQNCMHTNTIQAQQAAATTGLPSVSPVDAPTSSAAPENYGAGIFGPAYVREGQRASGEVFPTYGMGGSLHTNGLASGEKQLADARAIKALEARDRQVRQQENAKGEAVGSRNFMYQTGLDGKKYAIETGAHAVRPETDSGKNGEAGASTQGVNGKPLSREDEALLQKLKDRDVKVRNHEAAHVMAAGGQAHGLPTYTYQTGPDGKRYAIGGSVNISMLKTGDAEHDARQAQNAYRAAMATGEPSPRDLQAAMKARMHASEVESTQQKQMQDAKDFYGALPG